MPVLYHADAELDFLSEVPFSTSMLWTFLGPVGSWACGKCCLCACSALLAEVQIPVLASRPPSATEQEKDEGSVCGTSTRDAGWFSTTQHYLFAEFSPFSMKMLLYYQ